jgi:hypothetical protein
MESISYIACTHNTNILEKCLVQSLILQDDDELIVIEGASLLRLGTTQE